MSSRLANGLFDLRYHLCHPILVDRKAAIEIQTDAPAKLNPCFEVKASQTRELATMYAKLADSFSSVLLELATDFLKTGLSLRVV